MIKKRIVLKNSKDINNFYKLLPLYNSFLFKFVHFDVKCQKSIANIEEIEKILNIKNRKKKLTNIIDKSCDFIDEHFKNEDICGFKHNKCYVQLRNNNGLCNGCCRKCIYQSRNGCTTKNIACKLFFCSEVRRRYKVLALDDVNILKCLSIKQRLIIKSDYFTKKEEVVKDLYLNSILIATLRIVFRMLYNLYKLNKNLQLIDK